MEGVAEHHLVAECGDLSRQHSFDRRLGRQRYERRCANIAVCGVQQSGAGTRSAIVGFNGQRGHCGILEARRHDALDGPCATTPDSVAENSVSGLASLLDVAHNIGYPVLFLLVMAESGGLPVPGETALITGAVLASQGKLQIAFVIVIAAAAAIVGDNLGYVIGRKGGRWLLERPGRFQRQRAGVLRTGEPFFERHGPKAVFFGRFLLGLRVWASWLAGATHMSWRSFATWNAAGGICWATGIGLLAYFIGHSASNALDAFGVFGFVAVLIALASALFLHHRHRRAGSAPTGSGESSRSGADPEQGSAPQGKTIIED